MTEEKAVRKCLALLKEGIDYLFLHCTFGVDSLGDRRRLDRLELCDASLFKILRANSWQERLEEVRVLTKEPSERGEYLFSEWTVTALRAVLKEYDCHSEGRGVLGVVSW